MGERNTPGGHWEKLAREASDSPRTPEPADPPHNWIRQAWGWSCRTCPAVKMDEPVPDNTRPFEVPAPTPEPAATHEHVLVRFYVTRSYAEVAVKCTKCFRVWAGNLPEVDNPGAYYSPDEADEMRKRWGAI